MDAQELSKMQKELRNMAWLEKDADRLIKALFEHIKGNIPKYNHMALSYHSRMTECLVSYEGFNDGSNGSWQNFKYSEVTVTSENYLKFYELLESKLKENGYSVKLVNCGWRKYNGWLRLVIRWDK